ncbi:unnamed protein product [Caenorhabditis sp. 36 PRJEB53466]|nr:unnamed protein product [Caenorhabditis sp. 36 PRJEB53466]
MADSARIVELIVGHSSTRLSENREDGHTHQWTLFVKPANKEYDNFVDNKLIHKVKFHIHESFRNPVRYVCKPPFKITETGFASFSTYVTIYLNLPNQKPHIIPYELNLFTGDQDVQEEVQKLVIRGDVIDSSFIEQVRKFCKTKKRKSSVIFSHEEKSPPEPKKQKRIKKEDKSPSNLKKESEKHRSYSKSKKPKESSPEKSIVIPKIEIETPHDSPDKRKDIPSTSETKRKALKSPTRSESRESTKKPKSAEEITKKLNELTDPYLIYKASEYLLTLPNTTLSSTTLRLNFDLSNCSSEINCEVGHLFQ